MGATDRTVISGTVGRPTEHQQMLKNKGNFIRHRKVLNIFIFKILVWLVASYSLVALKYVWS